jgi:hypothetical protein
MMHSFTKILFTYILLFFSFSSFASNLVLIQISGEDEARNLFDNTALVIHYYDDEMVIATSRAPSREGVHVLDNNPWADNYSYYIVYTDERTDRQSYLEKLGTAAEVLYDDDYFYIIRTDETVYGQLPPAKNDGMVRIFDHEARLPVNQSFGVFTRTEPDPFILDLLDQVSGTLITDRVQHLENYGTRYSYALESVLAQQWIAGQFQSWGLDVELMDFGMPGGSASDNVIARITGTKYPEEYIVLGGHYDSVSWSGLAPGADDNASGTSGVMEAARILSQYEFDRSIVFIAFSGEEQGLYGSAAYASEKAQEGKNILGYFNMDMIGYLEPGHTTIMSSLIYPQSAAPLADFYTAVSGLYLPDFVIEPGFLSGGSSDHASFNNNGFMGIFPFEDVDNYSPYIHSSNDLVGQSYNNEEQAVIFTQAIIASVVTMANMITPPQNLVAIPGDAQVELSWDEMADIDNYNIYRDGSLIASTTENYYLDVDVQNEILYQYHLTAIYSDTGEESDPSVTVSVTPMPPLSLPLFLDFENGTPYWDLDTPWGLTTQHAYSPEHSFTESPNANYGNNRDDYATLQPLNLTTYTDATVSFRTRYKIETNWDYMYLQISTNGVNWSNLDTYTGNQTNWVLKTYPLTDYIGQPYVQLRFRFDSDHIITDEGMFIDDFLITVEGGGLHTVEFDVVDNAGNPVDEAVVTFNGIENDPGVFIFEDVEPGSHTYYIDHMCFTQASGEVVVSDNELVDVVLAGNPGDANGDGVVNVLDVISITTYFLGNDVEPFCFQNADTNSDQQINVIDVIGTINFFAEKPMR